MGVYDELVSRYGPVLTTSNVAEVLHRHKSHVRALCQSGELPGVRIGERWHIPAAKLAELLEGGTQCTGNAKPEAAQL